MASVAFVHTSLSVGGATLLRDLSFEAGQGEFVGVIGPSGSGKSTLLRAVAGFVDVTAGALLIDGVDVSRVKPGDRDIGMVFQDPALFSHRSVGRNVAFPLEIRRQHVEEIRQRVGAEARAMHLEHLLERRPDQLSRGEAQLVQVARAMVRTPGILLLDEPLASLDEPTQARMRSELTMLQAGYGVTTVMSTNDPRDAMLMPSKLAVIDGGTIVQQGTPDEVRRAPYNLDAALATGDCFTIAATVERDVEGFWLVGRGPTESSGFRHRAWSSVLADHVGREVTVGVRPTDVEVHPNGSITARVTMAMPGQPIGLICEVAGCRIGVATGGRADVGDLVRLSVGHIVVFDPDTGLAVC